ncbi:MAG: Prolipoprotein diacylglyceryl transferase [Phycisphaerae bacterium]|nr:Prolipoprotein diacylglyceryl transferase [Phycisphaerae bacterium]
MMPVVFHIPFVNRPVPGFGLMLMIGFLLSIVWATRRAARSGANPDVILNCGFIGLIAGVVGCRVMYVAHYWDDFARYGHPLKVIFAIFDVTRGGLEFYGGVILTAIATLVYLRRWGHSVRWYLDILTPSLALGLAIGRLGCFLNGCCWGDTCDLPWAVRFPFGSNAQMQQWEQRRPGSELPQQLMTVNATGVAFGLSRESLAATDDQLHAADAAESTARSKLGEAREQLAKAGGADRELARTVDRLERDVQSAAAQFSDIRSQMRKYGLSAAQLRALAARHPALPVHPTQIYETINALLLALLLNLIYWRRTRDGQVFFLFFAIQPLTRWLLESIRADNPIDTLGVFTISQFIALAMTAVGILGLVWLRSQPPRSQRARLFVPEESESPEQGPVPARA